ncbi:MAG: hypothetical protein CMA63_01835 [Euryarchaeota archaeon]|nr:hypothetical protein [Euryarchaeota archaeon]
MAEDDSDGWLDDDEPFSGSNQVADSSDSQTSVVAQTDDTSPSIDETKSPVIHTSESPSDTVSLEQSEQTDSQVSWNLPLRVGPVLKQFHGEDVTEYPLMQTLDGTKTTSLILDDDLLRIIEARLDDAGQRRLKVSLSMKREITGFKPHHNELMHGHQWLWVGGSVVGLLLMFLSSSLIINFAGLVLISTGLFSWSSMHLEAHTLEFSNSGGMHSKTLRGYGTNRPFFRSSMALLGSEIAGLQKTGILDTSTLEQLHATLALPPPTPEPVPEPPLIAPPVLQPAPAVTPMVKPPPPTQIPPPPTSVASGPPASTSQSLPTPLPPPVEPPAPLPLPTPPPPAAIPPQPAALAPPMPLPLPAPLPPLGGGAMPPPPPLGAPLAPIPLDAPLPNAPEISVAASPVEETLSQAEQHELLNELS